MNALVTGGTRGIGLAMVRALRAAGHKVAVVARAPDFQECDFYIRADLSRRHERYRLVGQAADVLGGLDVLVNNAGRQAFVPAVQYPATQMDGDLALMLSAPFELAQQAAAYMKNHGHIVNILSISAFQGARNIAGYIAAKHGLLGLTRALAVELAPLIHVNAIAPGLIDTDMTADIPGERKALLESITPAGRFGKPEEVAGALMYLINSTYIYGQTIFVDGGWMAKNG